MLSKIDLNEFQSWDYEEGTWFYSTTTYNNFAVEARPLGEYFMGMELIIPCPYCPACVGACGEEDIPVVKAWMGEHLAKWHSIEVEKDLLRKEQREEYNIHLFDNMV